MIRIEASNVTVMVSNLDRSIKFYTEILGFELKNRYGDHWADIEAPGMTIGLHPTDKELATGENLQIGLRVADLEKAVKDLESSGVKCRMNDDDQVLLAFFNDPDKNTLYLVQTNW